MTATPIFDALVAEWEERGDLAPEVPEHGPGPVTAVMPVVEETALLERVDGWCEDRAPGQLTDEDGVE